MGGRSNHLLPERVGYIQYNNMSPIVRTVEWT